MPTPSVYNKLMSQMQALVTKWRDEAGRLQQAGEPGWRLPHECADDLAGICGEPDGTRAEQ